MADQYSGGRSSSGAKAGAGGAFLPTAEAIFSITLLLGMRQLAGRSIMPRVEHNKNTRVEPRRAEKMVLSAQRGCRNHGPPFVLNLAALVFGVPRSWPRAPIG